MEYELLFFISLANEDKVDLIKKELTEIIESFGGNITGFTDIGKRKFAYPIKRQTHGFFSYARFNLEDKGNLSEINQRISLKGKIMRHSIVRADDIGKPIASFAQTPARELPARKIKAGPAPEKKPAEDKGKANLNDLDEKLNEILEKTPS